MNTSTQLSLARFVGGFILGAMIFAACGDDPTPEPADPPATEFDVGDLADTPAEALELMMLVSPEMERAVADACDARLDGLTDQATASLFGPLLDEAAAEWGFTGEDLVLAVMEQC